MSENNKHTSRIEKSFNYFVGCATIVGTVIAIIAFVWTLTHPYIIIPVITAISGAPTGTPQILPTYTLFPTYTPLPTHTPFPSFTPTPQATNTQRPTSTPSITPTSTQVPYRIGDEWSDGRVVLKITEGLVNAHWTVGFVNYYFVISLALEFENLSGETILLRYDTESFSLTDNRNRKYECIFRDGSPHFTNEPISKSVQQGDKYEFIVGCGKNEEFDKNVTHVIFSIKDFSSLGYSEWIIDIPK